MRRDRNPIGSTRLGAPRRSAWRWTRCLARAGLAGIALFAWAAIAQARSLALVIGNDSYANVTALKTAVGDARAVGDQLEKMGFIVRRSLNVDQRAMSRALAAFDAELQPGDRALFFFSGHGFEISGANYLLPIDVPSAQVNQVGIVRDAAFSVEGVLDGVRKSGARLTVLVLDACRDNPFASPGRAAAGSGGLARIDAPEGVFVLMSAGAKQEALDRLSDSDDEKNSVFTRTFLRELAKPGQTLVQIAKATQVEVRDLAATIGYEQTPAYYDQVVGDVVLSDASSDSPVASPALVAQAAPPPVRQQTAALTPDPKIAEALKVGGQAPIANFMRSNAGWTVTLSLPEPATAISYRIGDAGEFKPTGVADYIDQRTGQRAPNPSFPLSSKAAATIIQVRYETPDGASVGPFPIWFDPEAALFREQKQILEQMPGNWVEFRDFNGTLIYFTTLVTYRCAIAELRYGLDDGKPLQRYDLPGCNAKDPFSVPENAKLYLKAPPKTKSVSLQITWRDGTQSEVSTIERN
ncbi:caspase family protein [Methylocapsa sp. S129]|uniref:caspase family protein n=1 Tax=Methylocapsa sp. S129 TaxID=1641869 RepID=UPI00131ADDD1|nr:caspase family protein [Methylocapsa sp. S129]